jgi:uncharacterized membrane protein YqiK
MFLINKIEQITSIVVEGVRKIELGPVHLIDSGDGQALPRFAAAYPAAVASVLQSLVATTGVDITSMLADGRNGVPAARGGALMPLLLAIVGIVVLFLIVLSLVITAALHLLAQRGADLLGGQRASAGKSVGYRVIKGGRAIRIPMLEAVDRMDLTNMPIEVAVTGAYCEGRHPAERSRHRQREDRR